MNQQSDLFKDVAWEGLVKLGLSKLFAAVPWLGWGPIGYIVSWVVLKYADQLYDAIKMFVAVEVIGFRNAEFQAAWERSAVTLKILARETGELSKQYLEERAKHKKSLSDFANYEISRLH